MTRRISAVLVCLGVLALWGPGVRPAPARDTALTIKLAGHTLPEALPLIGECVGQTFRGGPNSADWRVFLFSNGRPIDEFKSQLKKFIPFTPGSALWYRNGSAWMFDEDLASLEARRKAARLKQQERYRQRARGLAEVGEWVKPNPADDKYTADTRARLRKYWSMFQGAPPAARDSVLRGRFTSVPFSQFPRATQDIVRDRISAISRSDPNGTQFIGARDYKNCEVEFRTTGPIDDPQIMVTVRAIPTLAGTGIEDIAHAPERLKDGDREWGWSRFHKTVRNEPTGPPGREKIPELQRIIQVKDLGGKKIEQVLEEVALRTGMPVLGEYDPCYARRTPRIEFRQIMVTQDSTGLKLTSVPIWQALDAITARFRLRWEYQRPWIWIRSPRTVLAWGGEVDLSPPANPNAPGI